MTYQMWKGHRTSRLGLKWRVIYRVAAGVRTSSPHAAVSMSPQATISAIENDRVNLGVERAKALAQALKCHPAVLVFPGWDVERDSAA